MRANAVMLVTGALALGACGSTPDATGPGGTQPLLVPPPAGQGVQFRMISSLEPGQEIERVQFFVVPPEGLYVNREEVKYSVGSHHVLLYRTPYKSIPTSDNRGRTVDTSGVVDAPNGGTADWNIDGVVAGAQTADAPPIVDGLPPGVAFRLEPGTVLLMNTHYLNASPAKLDVEADINMWSIPKAEVQQEAGVLFYYDPIIRVPAMSTGYAEMACPVTADINIVNLQTHMHRRGVGGAAFVTPPGAAQATKIYTSSDWEQVNVEKMAPAMAVKAGSWIDYHCDFDSKEPNTVLQGLSTHDEMCMLIGLYYPRDAKTELCSTDGAYRNLSTAGTWMGKGGTNDCLASLSCVFGAGDQSAVYDCILKACPSAAKAFNDTAKCMQAEMGQCTSKCVGDANPSMCKDNCLKAQCAVPYAACSAASCK